MFYRGHLDVSPQQLTRKGSRVERALAEYRKGVNPPDFTTGHVDGCPSLKLVSNSNPELEAVSYHHPYTCVKEMYRIAEQSQVGTDKETDFRPEARKSKEFSSVEVLNKSWKDKVSTVCDHIGQVLAPGAKKINAELYKLLIYRKGDFFNRHQDAQHSAHMFATLLFFLPVEYTGGEFNIGRYWDKNVIEDKKIPGGCSWVAFYTDIHHRVNEVKGGFRVVLNYCLSFEGAMSPSRSLPRMDQSAAGVVTDYFTTFDKKTLAIPLTYEYTQATLFPDFLKGIDAYVYNALERITFPELHFVMYFDKTKVIRPHEEESDHEQVFQGVFLVKHDIAKKYFEILSESERRFTGVFEDDKPIKKERDGKYLALMEKVKASQENSDLEWIVERKSGHPNKMESVISSPLNFEYGEMGWLGNMTPAEEYYYLQAAIVVQGKK